MTEGGGVHSLSRVLLCWAGALRVLLCWACPQENPLRLGILGILFSCKPNDKPFASDFVHVEPLHWCCRTSAGENVVDFVMSSEHIEEDMVAALQLVSDRRPQDAPPIRLERVPWENGVGSKGDNGTSYERYISLYEQCGDACVRNVANVFRDDIAFFGCKGLRA